MTQQFKRATAVYRKIKDIDPENDIRVRIIGRVIGKQDGTMVVDDGTGKTDIILDDQNTEVNEIVLPARPLCSSHPPV